MSNWLSEDMEEATKTGGQLPNPKAPRLVKEGTSKVIKQKKSVLLSIDEDLHKQLSRLTNLRKLSGNQEATITGIFMEGLQLYLKKHKLPLIDALENGEEINISHINID